MEDVNRFYPLFQWLRRALVFLFTSEPGWILMGLLLILYLGLSLSFRWRSLKGTGETSPGVPHFLGVLFLEIASLLGRLAAALPTLLGVLVLLGLMVTASAGIEELTSFVGNQKEIARLQGALKHLETRYKVADVEVTDQRYGKTTLMISYYDAQGVIKPGANQMVTLPGRDIYVDSLVINFDFTEIEEGKVRNIALPYRVFSDEISAREGVYLDLQGKGDLPYLLDRNEDTIYGVTPEEYKESLQRVFALLTEPDEARQAGIRSTYGNALHRIVSSGDRFTLWIEQSGGLVIKEAQDF